MNQKNKPVIYWLVTGALLIFFMVIIGGITRLTHSGLSISNYKIITGVFPPSNDIEWQEAFNLYKKYPEYQKLNYLFTIDDFKSIYFWEWLHRLIGRLIGIVFIIPSIYFLITQKLNRTTLKNVIIIGILGGFQGFLGWYMVKSGLVNRPDVSHFRLSAHLITAFATFGVTFWTILNLIAPKNIISNAETSKILPWLYSGLIFLCLQIIWGGFVSGLDAGFIHNHWPMMNEGKFIHPTVLSEKSPIILNFVEGRSGVQFMHRIGSYIVSLISIVIVFKSRKLNLLQKHQKNSVYFLLSLVVLQFFLGVFTLLYAVPLWMGLTHQIGAFLLFGGMIYSLYVFKNNPTFSCKILKKINHSAK